MDRTSDPLRVLEAGTDYSDAVEEKFAHARDLAEAMRRELCSCLDRVHGGKRIELSPDRKTVSVYFDDVGASIPPRLNAKFGDIVHNYRSGLDALAWGLVHLDGGKPSQPHKVYFPFYRDVAAWDIAAGGVLASIPKDILARLRRVQPFHRAPVEQGIGIVLSVLSNSDKHRGAASVSLHLRRDFDREIRFRLESSAFGLHLDSQSVKRYVPEGSGPVDGLAVTYFAQQPFETFDLVSEPCFEFRVEYRGTYFALDTTLDNLDLQIRETLNVVTTGRFSWE